MPELSDVSCHFDDIDILDGYTGAWLFLAQLSSFNEAAKDGSTNKKRTMSVKPGIAIPTRRLISYFGEQWIVGDGNTDGLQNVRLRQTYWITKVIDFVERLSPSQVVSATGGEILASSKAYLKDTINFVTDSEYDPQWDFTLSIYETVLKGEYLSAGSKLYRVRSVHTTEGGFLVANCDELDGQARVPVQLMIAGDFDPVTEVRTNTIMHTHGVLFDPSKLFRFVSEADPRNHAGDMTLILAMSAPVGSQVTVGGFVWKVLTSTPELDGFNHHIRRA